MPNATVVRQLIAQANTVTGIQTWSAANVHTGAETHSGSETHSGVETHSGAETHSGDETHSGSETFSGRLTVTGVRVDPVLVISTSRITLSTSTHSGKTLVFTSGGTGSKHQHVVLPLASTLSSGFNCVLVWAHTGSGTSRGLTVLTSAAGGRKLNNSSRPIKTTTRLCYGASVHLRKVNNLHFLVARDAGNANSNLSSLIWQRV